MSTSFITGSMSAALLLLVNVLSGLAQGKAGKESSYYTAADFPSVKKYDTHIHIETGNTVLPAQAAKDNFHLISINGDWGPISEQQENALKAVKAYPAQVSFASSFDVKRWNEPTWVNETIRHLQQSFDKGAVGVKVWKNIGMELKDKDGKFVMIDHPRFDTILDFIEKNNLTLFSHQGEPRNCWLPLEKMTVKGDQNYFAKNPQYHMYLHPEYPSYEDQISARDRMIAKHPHLRIVSVHLASLEWSVDEIAKRLDKFPNLAIDLAARIEHLQLAAAKNRDKIRNFFIRYQDRILYGTDMVEGDDNSNASLAADLHDKWVKDWKFFVTDEKLTNSETTYQGLKLPKSVVDKIYAGNAEKWVSALKK